jgi:hypothetical protein
LPTNAPDLSPDPGPHPPPKIFEAYGLGRSIVDTAFTGSVSRIGGLNMGDLQREAESAWAKVRGWAGRVAGCGRGPLAGAVCPARVITHRPDLRLPCSSLPRAPRPQGFPKQALTKLDDYGFIQSRPK